MNTAHGSIEEIRCHLLLSNDFGHGYTKLLLNHPEEVSRLLESDSRAILNNRRSSCAVLEADHTTVWRWVQRYGPELDQRLSRDLKPAYKAAGATSTGDRFRRRHHRFTIGGMARRDAAKSSTPPSSTRI
jgi:hypothetical protein